MTFEQELQLRVGVFNDVISLGLRDKENFQKTLNEDQYEEKMQDMEHAANKFVQLEKVHIRRLADQGKTSHITIERIGPVDEFKQYYLNLVKKNFESMFLRVTIKNNSMTVYWDKRSFWSMFLESLFR